VNPLEALEAELKELVRKRNRSHKIIEICNENIEELEEAIEHLKLLPRYQEGENENE